MKLLRFLNVEEVKENHLDLDVQDVRNALREGEVVSRTWHAIDLEHWSEAASRLRCAYNDRLLR